MQFLHHCNIDIQFCVPYAAGIGAHRAAYAQHSRATADRMPPGIGPPPQKNVESFHGTALIMTCGPYAAGIGAPHHAAQIQKKAMCCMGTDMA